MYIEHLTTGSNQPPLHTKVTSINIITIHFTLYKETNSITLPDPWVISITISDMNNFLSTLDRRYQKKVTKVGGTVAKKVRVTGTPSSTPVPSGVPQWTIAPDYQGM